MKNNLKNYHPRALRKYITEFNKQVRAGISEDIKKKRKEVSEKLKAERKGRKVLEEIKIPKGVTKNQLVDLVLSRSSMKQKAESDFKNKTAFEGFEFREGGMNPVKGYKKPKVNEVPKKEKKETQKKKALEPAAKEERIKKIEKKMKRSDIIGKVKALGQKQVIKKRALASKIEKTASILKLKKAREGKKPVEKQIKEESESEDDTPDPPIKKVPKNLHKVWKNYMEERVGDYYSKADQEEELEELIQSEKQYLQDEKIRTDTSKRAAEQAKARNSNSRTRESMDKEFKADPDIKKIYKSFVPTLLNKYEDFKKVKKGDNETDEEEKPKAKPKPKEKPKAKPAPPKPKPAPPKPKAPEKPEGKQVTEEEIMKMTEDGTFTNKTVICKIRRKLPKKVYPKKNTSNEFKIISATIKKNKLILKVEDLRDENKGEIYTEKYTMKK